MTHTQNINRQSDDSSCNAAAAANEPDPNPQSSGRRPRRSVIRSVRALSDTRDLIASIKRNQKQNRLVETTLRSLKQLEHIGA
jgi:hypothetical protein